MSASKVASNASEDVQENTVSTPDGKCDIKSQVEKRLPKSEEKIKLSSPFVGGATPKEMFTVFGKVGEQVISKPNVVLEETAELAKNLSAVVTRKEEIAPEKGDRRFKDSAWHRSPMHQMAMHGYLAWSKSVNNIIENVGLDAKDKERMRYIASLMTDAMSPSNNLMTNPAALKEAQETGGKSLVEGFQNLLDDMASNNGMPSQVDKSAFEVGGNLAATSGAVVYKNELFELIQYTPKTDMVHERPMMFIPPVVNKYYLLDLAPGKSAVEYLVEQGFQTYMVSWRNPSREHAHWGLDEYVAAMVEGIEAIREITGSDQINLYAACTGAIPMSALLGYMAAKGKNYVKSASMVVAVLDSNDNKSLGLFANEETIAQAKMKSKSKGVLDGKEIGQVFTWMRPNDLVWNYWVNNYLMGKKPPAFDILYWNNDATRVTAKLHEELLDVFSLDLLRKPGGLTIMGEPIDLSKVDCDIYMVGGETDHISMWKGCFNSSKFFGGESEFVLFNSGHVQSIICPTTNPKAKYHHNSKGAQTAEEWYEGATEASGSWWEHWKMWLAQRSGKNKIAPKAFGSETHRPIIAAPGIYVMEK
ncbi:alpha/beta fold hydrolase [Terasakiella sp. A23]|uniref:alpha/beta fold hydrolase n=1 Tax=Terasakiella sp. FCG-A23 TaxID=3080561 RepID=UPI0029545E6D|nr:alpha/beta fold hydrolase [Terasakiella sp. A23]